VLRPGSMASPPPHMSFASPAAPVAPDYHGRAFALAVGATSSLSPPVFVGMVVRVLLNNGQLVRGTFVHFDPTMSPVLCDCVELHPQAGRHVSGPLVFPRAVIASLPFSPRSLPPLPVTTSALLLWLYLRTLRPPHCLPLPPIGWSTLGPPSTPLPQLVRYSTPIHHTPHILPPSS
jgi:small nuclear ribonucleoprotein (snRNP)-like protein